jgi:glutamine amidotransferase
MLDYKNKKISVSIINLKLNNIYSIYNALIECGYKVKIIDGKVKNILSDIVIIPGVGSFPKAMDYLKKTSLDKKIEEFNFKKKPIIGICLGMQLLFQKSNEFSKCKGLSLLNGEVVKISNKKLRVPNIGWNKIKLIKKSQIIKNNLDKSFFYFVHSYHCKPKNSKNILSLSNINKFNFCSSVQKDNLLGMQFHPEKSGIKGLKIINNFKNLIS